MIKPVYAWIIFAALFGIILYGTFFGSAQITPSTPTIRPDLDEQERNDTLDTYTAQCTTRCSAQSASFVDVAMIAPTNSVTPNEDWDIVCLCRHQKGDVFRLQPTSIGVGGI